MSTRENIRLIARTPLTLYQGVLNFEVLLKISFGCVS